MKAIQSTCGAFAALMDTGLVATWGHENCGGDSNTVREQLQNIQQIQSNFFAFAAISNVGSVVTWGDGERGGDSSAVQHQLRNVRQIQAGGSAFAAILDDGPLLEHNYLPGDSCVVPFWALHYNPHWENKS